MAQVDRRRFLGMMGATASAGAILTIGLKCNNGESENSRIHKEFNDAFDLLFTEVNGIPGMQLHQNRTGGPFGLELPFDNSQGKGILIMDIGVHPSKLLAADIEEAGSRTIRINMQGDDESQIVATWYGNGPLSFPSAEKLNSSGYMEPQSMTIDQVQQFLARVRTIVTQAESK